jgi:hypothetical protein
MAIPTKAKGPRRTRTDPHRLDGYVPKPTLFRGIDARHLKEVQHWGSDECLAHPIAEEPIMNNVDAKKRPAPPSPEDDDDDSPVDDFEESESEAADDLSDATGIDLTDASELDADNVPADEEFARVMNAPD